jgi:hypothetical protein
MRDGDIPSLPAGYHLDLISDPDTITLQRPNGTIVGRFTRDADPEEIKATAEEDATGEARPSSARLEGLKGSSAAICPAPSQPRLPE